MKTASPAPRRSPSFTCIAFLAVSSVISLNSLGAKEPAEILRIWPGEAPDEVREIGEEKDITTPDDRMVAGKRVARITNVTVPELHFYPAPADSANGTSVVIYPGGGYHVLAWDLEGTEVAEWLNSIGVSAWVLKYRVPRRQEDEYWKHALQDAQRSVSLVRHRADGLGLNPDRIGVLGFSAGGNLGFLSSAYNGERVYTYQDSADSISWRPDFAILIYPAYLTKTDSIELAPHFSVGPPTPPMFLVHAADDPVTPLGSIGAFTALKRAGVDAEVHIYTEGGHGYGMRRTEDPVTSWPERCREWMQSRGLLEREPSFVEGFAVSLKEALQQGGEIPELSRTKPDSTLHHGYLVQRALVEELVGDGRTIAGFKGGVVTAASRKKLGTDGPLSAVLFRSGWHQSSDNPVVSASVPNLMIETEVGFIVGEEISKPIGDVKALKRRIRSVVPVIELPGGRGMSLQGISMTDLVARNAGSLHYIVGKELPAEETDPDSVFISLQRNGRIVNVARGDEADGGQWLNLLHQVNHAIEYGHTLKPGQLVITGALGRVVPGAPGHYQADFGSLGSIRFQLEE